MDKSLVIYKKTILILSSIFLVITFYLLSTYEHQGELVIPIMLFIFWWIIIWIIYLCYKYFHKKLFLTLLIVILFLINSSMIRGIIYENKVNKIEPGMSKIEVESLYWTGISGLWYWSKWLWSADCLKCKWNSYQFYYRLNANLWYSHIEDTHHVCFLDDIVCDFSRIWL